MLQPLILTRPQPIYIDPDCFEKLPEFFYVVSPPLQFNPPPPPLYPSQLTLLQSDTVSNFLVLLETYNPIRVEINPNLENQNLYLQTKYSKNATIRESVDFDLKFSDVDGPNLSVAKKNRCQFHILLKYISVWVDLRQFLFLL